MVLSSPQYPVLAEFGLSALGISSSFSWLSIMIVIASVQHANQ